MLKDLTGFEVEKDSLLTLNHADRLKEKARKYSKVWREKNPEKRRAHSTLWAAIKAGTVKKLRTCQRCRKRPRRIVGHHSDYNKPLEVEWLCGLCHLTEHGMRIGKRVGGRVAP